MAMTVCIECGKPVSTDALACPSCGKPLKLPPPAPPAPKKGMPWYVGCLIAFAALFVVLPVVGLLAAIAIPSFVKARSTAQENACMNNLHQISIAKETLAVEGNYQPGDVIDPAAMEQALGKKPTCPAGGQYTYGTFGQEPSCSEHGMLQAPTTVDVESSSPSR